MITCGTNEQSCAAAVEMAEKYDNVYAAVGIYRAHRRKGVDLESPRPLFSQKTVAIGEIGLEYHS